MQELVQYRDSLIGEIRVFRAGSLALEGGWAVKERWADDEGEFVGGEVAESDRIGPVRAGLGFAARVAEETDAGIVSAGIPV